MKTIIRTILLVLCGTSVLSAAEPPRIVVLDNENLMEGVVTRDGDRYVIRAATSELSLPHKRVLAVVNNKQEAFNVVAERANRRDADERLRLARWCAQNDLLDLAISEAKAATEMRPGFAAAEQFIRATEATKALPRSAPVAKTDTPAKDEKLEDVPTIDYNSESFPLFSTRVNAILTNLCANCHAGDTPTKFRLVRTPGRVGIGKNLMSALAQINTKDPLTSPLLTKAVTPHGSALEAPLKTRNHPAYSTLETWVRFARATEGTQEPEPLPPPAVVSAEPQKLPMLDDPKMPKVEGPKNDTIKIEVPAPRPTMTPTMGPAVATPSSFGADSKTPPPPTTDKTNSADPFDPATFNNQRPPRGK